MTKNIYLFLVFFTVSINSKALEQLLNAIEKQDIQTIKKLTVTQTFTNQEKRIVLAKAESVAAECERRAWLSEQTKKSALAITCIGLLAISGEFLKNSLGWVMYLDTREPQSMSLSRIMASLSNNEVRYFSVQSILFGASIAGGILAGRENMSGYYTNTHNFIKNFLYQNLK